VGWQVIVDLHKAKSNKAVKPSVGYLLNGWLEGTFFNADYKRLPLPLFVVGQYLPGYDGSVFFAEAGIVNAVLVGPLSDLVYEFAASPDGEFLNGVLVDGMLLA
jgi:hypothetical protein